MKGRTRTRKGITREEPNEASMGEADESTLVSRATEGLCTDQNGIEVIGIFFRFVPDCLSDLVYVCAVTQFVDEPPGKAGEGEQGRRDEE